MGDAKVSMFNSSKVLHLRVRLLVGRVLAVLWPFFWNRKLHKWAGCYLRVLRFSIGRPPGVEGTRRSAE